MEREACKQEGSLYGQTETLPEMSEQTQKPLQSGEPTGHAQSLPFLTQKKTSARHSLECLLPLFLSQCLALGSNTGAF